MIRLASLALMRPAASGSICRRASCRRASPSCCRLGPQLGPDPLIAAGAFEEAVEQGLDVQGRSADGDDGLAAAADVVDGCQGLVEEHAHAERLARLDHVDQMVSDLLLGLFGGLGRADVHAAVDLHRVHADDLAVQRPGQLEPQPGLAGSRHAQDQDHSMIYNLPFTTYY